MGVGLAEAAATKVASTALQLVLELRLNVPRYDPGEVAVTASSAARDVLVSCCSIVSPLPAVTVPV